MYSELSDFFGRKITTVKELSLDEVNAMLEALEAA